jgi:hypothetical protein
VAPGRSKVSALGLFQALSDLQAICIAMMDCRLTVSCLSCKRLGWRGPQKNYKQFTGDHESFNAMERSDGYLDLLETMTNVSDKQPFSSI